MTWDNSLRHGSMQAVLVVVPTPLRVRNLVGFSFRHFKRHNVSPPSLLSQVSLYNDRCKPLRLNLVIFLLHYLVLLAWSSRPQLVSASSYLYLCTSIGRIAVSHTPEGTSWQLN